MEDLNIYVKGALRPFFIFYLFAALLSALVLSSALFLGSYAAAAATTAERLGGLRIRMAKANGAVQRMNDLLAEAGKGTPRGTLACPPETYISMGLDSVKYCFAKSEMGVGVMEEAGNETRLAVTIKGPISDYGAFLKGLGSLQAMKFPFFTVSSLSITVAKGEAADGETSYEIQGLLSTPKAGTGDTTERERQGAGTNK